MLFATLLLFSAALPEYATLPVAPIAPTGSWSVAVDASLLVWQAQEQGLEFAAKNNPRFGISSAIPVDINASLIGLDFSWQPAYKINLDFQSFGTGWDLDFRWTGFYSNSSQGARASTSASGSGLFPLWLLPNGNNGASPLFGWAHGEWQLHLNELDWELGHSYRVSEAIDLRFFGGLKGLLIEQIYRVRYANGFSGDVAGVISGAATMKNDFWGVGPRCGLRTGWFVTKAWSIQAGSAVSFILSQFHIKRDDTDVAVTLPSTDFVTDTTFKESFWVYRPAFEGSIGIRWNGEVSRYAIAVEGAYEMQYFWEQNMFLMLVNSSYLYANYPRRGDLMLQGFTGTVRCAF